MTDMNDYIHHIIALARSKTIQSEGVFFAIYDEMLQKPCYINKRRHWAIEFAAEHHCPEILGQYSFPEGVSHTDVQTAAMALKTFYNNSLITDDQYDAALDKIWSELVRLNPPLERLKTYENAPMNYLDKPDTPMRAKFHLIMGVSDQFNVDDIEAFMVFCSKTPVEIYNEAAKSDARKSFVRDHMSFPNWRLSEKTLNYLAELANMRRSFSELPNKPYQPKKKGI